MDEIFSPLSSQDNAVAAFEFLAGHRPNDSQYRWFVSYVNRAPPSTDSVFLCVDPAFHPSRKTVVFYSTCHLVPIMHYLHVHARYLRIHDVNWVCVLATNWAHPFRKTHTLPLYFWLLENACRRADYIVYSPMFRGTDADPMRLRADTATPHQRWIGFHAPSFGALWPLCHKWGDEQVAERLSRGESAEAIKTEIRNGSIFCDLKRRWQHDFERLLWKDDEVVAKIVPFFERNWKTHRLFLSLNHPSYHLASCLAMQIEKALVGHAPALLPWEEHFCLYGVPLNPCGMLPVLPDHPAVVRELGISYPQDFPDVDRYYEGVVDQIGT